MQAYSLRSMMTVSPEPGRRLAGTGIGVSAKYQFSTLDQSSLIWSSEFRDGTK